MFTGDTKWVLSFQHTMWDITESIPEYTFSYCNYSVMWPLKLKMEKTGWKIWQILCLGAVCYHRNTALNHWLLLLSLFPIFSGASQPNKWERSQTFTVRKKTPNRNISVNTNRSFYLNAVFTFASQQRTCCLLHKASVMHSALVGAIQACTVTPATATCKSHKLISRSKNQCDKHLYKPLYTQYLKLSSIRYIGGAGGFTRATEQYPMPPGTASHCPDCWHIPQASRTLHLYWTAKYLTYV